MRQLELSPHEYPNCRDPDKLSGHRAAHIRGRNAARSSEIRQGGDHASRRGQAGHEGHRLDRIPGHGAGADTGGDQIGSAAETPPVRPKSGKVEIMPLAEVKQGMKGTAWTVFQGTEPEPIPVEIVGIARNMWGPKQDIILGKMGGKAARTNVAKGMSGSPVYINGKLIGAVSLGLSQFSPDAICGITPIELMLEINGSDQSHPAAARTPGKAVALNRQAGGEGGALSGALGGAEGSALSGALSPLEWLAPIDSPLVFSGINGDTLRDFSSVFQQMGLRTVQRSEERKSTRLN